VGVGSILVKRPEDWKQNDQRESRDSRHKTIIQKSIKNKSMFSACSGFYEWKTIGTKKIPHYIGLKDSKIFCLAGLYDVWKESNGTDLKTFTIITTRPNNTLKPIHNRMPVILQQELEDQWLNIKIQNQDSIKRLLMPYPDDDMISYAVSNEVNNTENDNPQLIKQVHC